MKKNIIFFVVLLLLGCCSSLPSKPDKRDKYVGEYKLYENDYWHGESKSYIYPYEMEWYSHKCSDSTQSLIVKKDLNDTTSLTFYIVKPFDFEKVERIKKENEEIKKRNAESICGKDEPLKAIPTPTYDDKRDIVNTYYGYVDGHKIFLKDFQKKEFEQGYGYNSEYEFDSVYLMNDTLHFNLKCYSKFTAEYENSGWRYSIYRFIAVKENNK